MTSSSGQAEHGVNNHKFQFSSFLQHWEQTLHDLQTLCYEQKCVLRSSMTSQLLSPSQDELTITRSPLPIGQRIHSRAHSSNRRPSVSSSRRGQAHFGIGRCERLRVQDDSADDEVFLTSGPSGVASRAHSVSQGRYMSHMLATEIRVRRINSLHAWDFSALERSKCISGQLSPLIPNGSIAAALVALSLLLETPTSDGSSPSRPPPQVYLGEFLSAVQPPLNVLLYPHLPLPELCEYISRFLRNDPRFAGKFRVEIQQLDVLPANGHVARKCSTTNGADAVVEGLHERRVTLPQFRRQLTEDLAGHNAVMLLSFDPHALEQNVAEDDSPSVSPEFDDWQSIGLEHRGEEDGEDISIGFESGQSITSRGAFVSHISDPGRPPSLHVSHIRTSAARQLGASASSSVLIPAAATHPQGDQSDHPHLDHNLQQQRPSSRTFQDEDEDPLFLTTNRNLRRVNSGMTAVVADFREAASTLTTLAEAALLGPNKLRVQLVEVPCSAVYDSMTRTLDAHGRPRGFLRIERIGTSVTGTPYCRQEGREMIEERPSEKHSYPCNQTTVVVSAPLIACTHALEHLLGHSVTVDLFFKTLKLSLGSLLRHNFALEEVQWMLLAYAKLKPLPRLEVQAIPITATSDRPTAVPSLAEADLSSILEEVTQIEKSEKYTKKETRVLLLQYNANVAHGAYGISHLAEWAQLIAYNGDSRIAVVRPAQCHRFGSTVCFPLERLHEALVGHGCLLLTKSRHRLRPESKRRSSSAHLTVLSRVAQHLGSDGYIAPAEHELYPHYLSCARDGQVSQLPMELGSQHHLLENFAFPPIPLALTACVLALSHVGTEGNWSVSPSEFIHASPFKLRTVLSPKLSLHGCAILMDAYAATVTASHQSTKKHNPSKHLCIRVQHAVPFRSKPTRLASVEVGPTIDPVEFAMHLASLSLEKTTLLVHYSSRLLPLITRSGREPFGEFGVILSVQPLLFNNEQLVTVMDTNPDPTLRIWQVSSSHLFDAMADHLSPHHGPRGLIQLWEQNASSFRKSSQRRGGFSHFAVPLYASASHSPKSPQVYSLASKLPDPLLSTPAPLLQALTLALAQLGERVLPQELFYKNCGYLQRKQRSPLKPVALFQGDIDQSYEDDEDLSLDGRQGTLPLMYHPGSTFHAGVLPSASTCEDLVKIFIGYQHAVAHQSPRRRRSSLSPLTTFKLTHYCPTDLNDFTQVLKQAQCGATAVVVPYDPVRVHAVARDASGGGTDTLPQVASPSGEPLSENIRVSSPKCARFINSGSAAVVVSVSSKGAEVRVSLWEATPALYGWQWSINIQTLWKASGGEMGIPFGVLILTKRSEKET